MRPNEVDLGLDLLDDQLIDVDGWRCGRVDDIELRGGPGQATRIEALLSGVGVWRNRLPRVVAPAIAAVTPPYMHRIPWDAVSEISTTVRLGRARAELGLNTNDGKNVRWVHQNDEGSLLLSSLLGARAVSAAGDGLGRVFDARVERITTEPNHEVNEPWLLTGLLVGARGILQRFGATPDERGRKIADPPPNFIGWQRVVAVKGGVVRIAER